MVNQAKFEGEAHGLLRYLKEKRHALELRHTHEMAEIDREIDAVSITVRLLREAEHTVPASEKKITIPSDLKGKSARAACVEIAKSNDGVSRVSDVRVALVKAGILKEGKNTWGIVYTTLNRSKDFEKLGTPGTFRLVTANRAEQSELLQ